MPNQKTQKYDGFTEEERLAMKERAAELKSSSRRTSAAEKAEADEQDALTKIAEMSGTDRDVAQRLHAIVKATAPELAARTWYGMPAYAKDGKVVLFIKPAAKFKVRYAEIGFSDSARMDDGDMWPTAYAVTAMNPAVEKSLTELVKRAVS